MLKCCWNGGRELVFVFVVVVVVVTAAFVYGEGREKLLPMDIRVVRRFFFSLHCKAFSNPVFFPAGLWPGSRHSTTLLLRPSRGQPTLTRARFPQQCISHGSSSMIRVYPTPYMTPTTVYFSIVSLFLSVAL